MTANPSIEPQTPAAHVKRKSQMESRLFKGQTSNLLTGVVGVCAGTLEPIRGCHRAGGTATALTPTRLRTTPAETASAQAAQHGHPPRLPTP